MSGFSHGEVYNPVGSAKNPKEACDCPKVFIAPPHYIQGPNVMASLGRYSSKLLSSKKVGVLIPEFLKGLFGATIEKSLKEADIEAKWEIFPGIPSVKEIERIVAAWKDEGLDAVLAVGGGSCNDCGKGVAFKLKIHCVVVSTQCATDAPCSALSIIYTPEGAYEGGWTYPQSPVLVVVDTDVILNAPSRSLVSGFGDALSTYYEARTCWENPKALSMCEARPTATAYAIGEKSAQMLYENAEKAMRALSKPEDPAAKKAKTDEAESDREALEMVVEANTLLSGIGFESGGLAASHAVAQALSWVPSVHHKHLHGEMVSMGLITMLCMEDTAGLKGRKEELQKVGEFLVKVGLPVTWTQIHFDPEDKSSVDTFLDVAMKQWFAHNEPFTVTKDIIMEAFKSANDFGQSLVAKHGDAPYQKIHGGK
eukprot:CAMPEP_0181315422 /NCGR_PEP_ID=MMETSP1101-20121128/15371_1 /TAXON_ID=46948 /ORGANISM="Rhodomonas abbreviata, Strain Caron Lab Isolate" /LENGTH=424 /DNA_ID=CAMNT_0023422637 /DNA_START=18 /DNA_END=1292 /DNA_ORIENTATION=+